MSAGGLATVNLSVSGLDTSGGLGAFDIDIGFDPSVLSFSGALFGDAVNGDLLDPQGFGSIAAVTGPLVTSPNLVNLFEVSFDDSSALTAAQAAQPSGFTLATLTFNALSEGVSSLILTVNSLSDAFGASIGSSSGGGSIAVSGGTVVAPEIDPASAVSALTLLLGGLVVLRGRRNQVR